MMISETLKLASQGLMMPSESDYPFVPFTWVEQATAPLTPMRLLQLTGHPPDSDVQTVELAYLFRNVAAPQDWHDSIQQENVAKFQALVATLTSHLTDLQVYRVGTGQLDVYIVGKTGNDLAGLATKVVET
jgi:Nuclease A inhibitor-like protein